ncbi:hypothetical protein AAHC03_05748 [Spirometra sp. Aus1]
MAPCKIGARSYQLAAAATRLIRTISTSSSLRLHAQKKSVTVKEVCICGLIWLSFPPVKHSYRQASQASSPPSRLASDCGPS